MKKDQIARMEEIVRLKKAMLKTDAAIDRAQDTLSRLWEKKSRQRSEYFTQNLLLKWNLP